MTPARAATSALFLFVLLLSSQAPARAAVPLPPTCASVEQKPDDTTSIPDLKKRVEALSETDPNATVALLCATIPRVAREYGEDSVELAWWVGSLATPLIAYMDKNAEALPLLAIAQSIFERRLGPNAQELADIHVAYAWIEFRQGRLAEAGAEWEKVLRIREIVPGAKKIELQKALVGLAQVRLALRDFDGARQALTRAQAILQENGDTVSEAAAAIENAFTNLEIRAESYVAARGHAEAQLRIEKNLGGGAPQLVPAYVLLGQSLERLDELEEAETALREALRLTESKEGPLQRHTLPALTMLGSLLNDRGRPDEALAFESRALTVAEATLGPDAPKTVRVLVYLAQIERALGNLPEALHVYERAAGIVERHRADVEKQTLVYFYRGYAGLLLDLGETEQAATLLAAGLEAAGTDPGLSTERAGVLLVLGGMSKGTNDDEARARLEEARKLLAARLPDAHPAILRVINLLCGLEVESGTTPDCDDALRRLESAREVEPALRSAVWENQSKLAEKTGDRERAEGLAVQALAAAEALGAPDPLYRAHYRLARLLHDRDERSLAIFFGKQSIAEIERLRGHFLGEDRRYDRGFLHDKVDVYRAVADWLMEAGRIDEGLTVLHLLKTEELYDFALRNGETREEAHGVELTPAEQALLERFAGSVGADAAKGKELDRLSRLDETGRISVQERERLATLLAGEREAEASRAGRIREFVQSGSPAPGKAEASVREVQVERMERERKRFGPDAALAFYLLSEHHLRVLVATEKGEIEARVPVDATALRRDIGRFLDGIGRRDDVKAEALVLYSTLAKPVDDAARRAGAKRLVLWLDGALRYVPFAALHDGKRYLVEKYAIETYADVGASGVATADAPWSVRGFGVTRAVAGYEALPAMADELCSIVHGPIEGLATGNAGCPEPSAGNGALRGEGFADGAFTEEKLESLLGAPRDFSVLHLGTHFRLRPGNAMRSFLVLGDGSKLTLDRIRAYDFHGIELMTLSACQTALGGATQADGREVEGLAAIVHRGGAKRVVASLWQVEDVSTAELMRAMYRDLAAGKTDATYALQRAQLSLRRSRPYGHPYYWAGFVLSGSAP